MTLKINKEPGTTRFVRMRTDGTPIESDGIDYILVPDYAVRATGNVFIFVEQTNGLIFYDDKGLTAENPNKTSEIRKKIIEIAPSVVGIGSKSGLNKRRIYYKGDEQDQLRYSRFEGGQPLRPHGGCDYIMRENVAELYANLAGICKPSQFRDARREGRLHHFGLLRKLSPMAEADGLNQIQLYLLAEVNALRG